MSGSGTKRTYRVALHMSAFGGKADMASASQMSAYDPKRTSRRPAVTAGYDFNRGKERRSVSAGSRIGNVRRSVAAHLAIDRRGLRLRWIEAVRCAVALSVDVDGLYRRAFRWDEGGRIDDIFLSS